ncbi:GNAT family N-acetyltransferase [Kribbella capetownensis]|uniref:GNAT family N-acetyltransferase n=1 Tax=Kribbella capetownensis TaxID=1572659 RepID=A0A4R0JRY2_9ACTN|nr:GNAT family N-acetyltransferase [Kribbella capetownensis]TCC47836.1 GNAT family N-acetyltransferase [Kribbella capetownensis]
MEIKSLGYRTDLLLLELSGSQVQDAGEYVVIRTPANPAYWWGNFLLYRSIFAAGDVKSRLETYRAEFPAAKHVAFGIDSVDGEIGAEDELAAAGFTVDRSVVMTASQVVAPRRPNEESTYRFLTSDDDWGQLTQLGLATASMKVDDGYVEFTRRRDAAHRALVEAGHGKWFGAFDGDRLQSSLGLMFDGKGVARFQHVQTHPDDRNRGIASTLVHHASTYGLTDGGARTLVMVADPEYLAIRLYRALGFDDTETQLQFTLPPAS